MELVSYKSDFFPANYTSRLWPFDIGMIPLTKGKYHKTLVQKAIAAIEENKTKT
jgi:hypothetical protein